MFSATSFLQQETTHCSIISEISKRLTTKSIQFTDLKYAMPDLSRFLKIKWDRIIKQKAEPIF